MSSELPKQETVSAEVQERRERSERNRAVCLTEILRKYESLSADQITALKNAMNRLKGCGWDEYNGKDITLHSVVIDGEEMIVNLDMDLDGYTARDERRFRISDFV